MAWSSSIYSFLQTTAISPGFFFTFDALIQEANPGLLFNGTEASAVFAVIREVAGDLWIVQNADWNGTNWIPKNLSIPVTLTVFRGPANGSFPSYLQKYVCAAGTNPVTFTNLIYQVSNTGQITSAGIKTGTVSGALADGSTVTVSYTAFPAATDNVEFTIVTADTSTLFGVPKLLSTSAGGFTFQIPGGSNGQTVNVNYRAYGH